MARNAVVILFVFFLTICLPTTVFSQPPPCGPSKVTTLPLMGEYGGPGTFAVTRNSISHPDPAVPSNVSVYLPNNATVSNRLPVIFFAHGFGGFAYTYYDALLRQIASNGYVVVFAPYSPNPLLSHPTLYQQMWSGFQLAVAQYGSLMDTTRVGFAGHSYGAGAVPELTRRGVGAGWGTNGLFMFVMAPWYSWGSNYDQIPSTAKLVVQVYWDDQTNQHLIAQNDVWNKLPQITERRWQVVRSDRRQCFLYAGHGVPVTGDPGDDGDGGINANDYWGVWRRIHALADYTFTGNLAAKPIAFGDDPHMGDWRVNGRRAVKPLETATTPVINTNTSPRFTWGTKCLYALGSPCP
ncbi:MAG: hypothetical protein ACJ72Z_03675 [Pyrinomonadaceae bacterium]